MEESKPSAVPSAVLFFSPEAPLGTMTTRLRLLIVDDSDREVSTLGPLLRQNGIEPVASHVDTPQALHAALAKSWDAVLLRFGLPRLPARDALATLYKRGLDVPVVLLADANEEEEAIKLLSAGAHEVLDRAKPARLASVLRRELRAAEARRQNRQTAELLRESEERYRALFLLNPQPMWILDAETRSVLAINDAAVQHYGYTREEFVKMTVDDLREAPGPLEAAAAVPREPGADRFLRHRKKDGTIIELEINTHDLTFHGRKAQLVLAQDVTESMLLREQFRQSQKMEVIGRLAGGVAHDFNNLLTVITGYSELLLSKTQAGEKHHFRGFIEEIKKAAERAAALTRQLLAFSRKQMLNPVVLDLNQLITTMGGMVTRLIGEDIDLATVLSPELRPVKADRGQIEQVMMNLVVNARDAMPKGGKLTIETRNINLGATYMRQHPEVRPGSYVMVAVSDTGCGMDERVKSHIFEPFFTTKEPGKGAGLGLATVYGIVKQSGGHIDFYSEPGFGTTFKIYLPEVQEALPAKERPPLAILAENLQGTETILLVEDEDGVRALASRVLHMRGYRVLVARDSEDAIRLSNEEPGAIQLMVTDVVMPGMNGRDLAKHIAPRRPQMKVLYLSGYTESAVFRHGVLEPETAFLQKPFAPDDLTRRVREVLDKPQ